MNKQLPERPDFGQLKKQAKELLDGVHAGEGEALARVAKDKISAENFALHDAQRVLAREYGFASWAKLKLHVETRTLETAEARLVDAVLSGERESVETILAERPGLARRSAWMAAALGDDATVAAELERDRAWARSKGGPKNWEPLLYVCFGRCGGVEARRVAAAKALLAAGADANVSFVERAWPESPQTALYGGTGVNDYPELARLLLAAGANPNDGESRYHAAEHHHVKCLEVLAEFGCDFSGTDKTWGNTPLYFLFGYAHPSSTVKAGVRWLLEHGANPNTVSHANAVAETALHAAVNHDWDAETLELLLHHGAEIDARRADGRTAYALAVRGGRVAIARLLLARKATPEISATDAFLGACMRGAREEAQDMLRGNPGLVAQLSEDDGRIALIAAREGRAAALEVMGDVGMNLDVSGAEGERPLHWAAWHGWAESVRRLIERGVELSVCDRRFGAPPSGWCAHGSEACRNVKGEYARVMEMLIAARAFVAPDTEGSPEVMAVLRRHGVRPRRV